MWGFFTTKKVDTSLYIFPNSAQTASLLASNCLQFPSMIVLNGWLEQNSKTKKKKKARGYNFTHVCQPEPNRWTDVREDAKGLLYFRSSAAQIPRWQRMIELSHLTLHYRPLSKTQPPPLGLHLSCPSLRTSGSILEGQGQPSKKCRRRLQ